MHHNEAAATGIVNGEIIDDAELAAASGGNVGGEFTGGAKTRGSIPAETHAQRAARFGLKQMKKALNR